MTRRDFTPRPWQPPIIDHMLQTERCGVWSPMGSGKSVCTLSALDSLFMSGEDHPVLILAPLRVAKDTWPEEPRKWNHLRHISMAPIVGSEKERRAALRLDASVYTTNFDNIEWLVEYYGERWPFRTLIVDEWTKLKSFRLRQGGKRAGALAKVAHTKVKRFAGLTGTPSPNGLQDLWGQLWFADGGQRLGRSFEAFKQRWFQRSYNGYGIDMLPHAQAEIQEKLRDICITIDLADYMDIGVPNVNAVYVDLPPKARKLYDEMEKQMFTEIEGHDVEAFNAASRTMKCLQIANGAAYIDDQQNWKTVHDAKLEALDDVLEEANGAPVLCAYHFKSDRARIMKAFPDAIDVALPEGLKAAKAGKGRLWIGHPASMGHGIDGLQEHCWIAAFFGHWWNLEERMQFIERVGPTRQMQAGKKRIVQIYNIVARDTVDEMVIERHDSKREVQDVLLAAMKRRG